MTHSDSSGLRRWSQRKMAARQRSTPLQEPDIPQTTQQQPGLRQNHGVPTAHTASTAPVADPVPPEPPEPSPAELARAHGLPDPTELAENDLIGDFMRPGIPSRLRQLAMRRMWRINPILANLDGLVDYGDDYTDAATVMENFTTLYKVGSGYRTPEDDKAPIDDTLSEETASDDVTAEPDAGLNLDEPSSGDGESSELPLPDGAAQPSSAISGYIEAQQGDTAVSAFPEAEPFDSTDTHPRPMPVRSRMVFVRRE